MGKRVQNMAVDHPEFRSVKAEKVNRTDHFQVPPPKRRRSDRPRGGGDEPVQKPAVDRRVIRSHYAYYKNLIHEEKEELCKGDSNRFQKIIREVDDLYDNVTTTREQVTDAETLLDMANTLVTTARSYSKDGLTPFDFITSLVRDFGVVDGRKDEKDCASIKWNAIGVLVCPIFKNAQGCSTMTGLMKTQIKPRKAIVRKKRTRVTGSAAKPEEVENSGSDHKKDTDKNMATMFNILKSKRSVCLENLILNRNSFAQTVENLFALSFLVKDGRAQITVNDNGTHLVSPKNAPDSSSVTSKEVSYNHFVFRFDFKDWKLMADSVPTGEELMPHRYQASVPLSQADTVPNLTPVAIPTSPTTKARSSGGGTMVVEL
ncbi:non-structural maintenance of chromosomes element 4 homolog A-like [Chenopodium quinoa]|uniref:non-structural maintenance of chromosomes element 4 homolog A-like n=1 Tax=Chenopodium quinoa TaxID=63459 RepID=UPI000B770A71|nr:non-structural maintenance of chromosomes element 4 homolog A-like [Chenopodium quinoa]